jgi:hypothetical protein
MTKAVWGSGIRVAGAVILVVASVSCGKVAREGTGSSFLIVKALQGSSGAKPGTFSSTLASDVITIVQNSPTVFNDLGQADFALGMKDPGGSGSPTAPTQPNWITIERYEVRFLRTDGRNTEGVDVPYAFGGALTATVSGDTSVGFTLVRQQAKKEAPLGALAVNGLIVSTTAEVTFYGHDQTGRAVIATASMTVTFANFGD